MSRIVPYYRYGYYLNPHTNMWEPIPPPSSLYYFQYSHYIPRIIAMLHLLDAPYDI